MCKIVMTGADGGLGSSVLRHLLRVLRSPRDVVLLFDRTPDAEWLQRCGAQLRCVDYADPASLDAAMAGVDVVVLVPWGPLLMPRPDGQKGVIDAASRAGARHVFYASMAFGGSQDKSLARVMQPHLATEAYLASIAAPLPTVATTPPCPRSSSSSATVSSSSSPTPSAKVGLTYTVIREAVFTESYPLYLGFFDVERPPTDDVVLLPTTTIDDDDNDGGAVVAWASREELGEATAQLVYSYTYEAECFPYVNETVVLSGPQALSLADVVRVLGRLLDRPALAIKRASSIDDYVERYAEAAAREPDLGRGDGDGGEQRRLREWATVYAAIEAGECGVVTSTLEDWLGRKPKTLEETLTADALTRKTLTAATSYRDQRPASTGLPK